MTTTSERTAGQPQHTPGQPPRTPGQPISQTVHTGQNAPLVSVPAPPSANTVLADLREAVETYADTYLRVEMYDVNPEGGVLNPGDTATFRLRVNNRGPLHIRGLTLLLSGANGTRVGRHGWTNGQVTYASAALDTVPAHMAAAEWVDVPDTDHDHFHFWVHSVMPESDLVRVTVQDWNLDLLHLLEGHTDPSATPHEVYRGQVFPN